MLCLARFSPSHGKSIHECAPHAFSGARADALNPV